MAIVPMIAFAEETSEEELSQSLELLLEQLDLTGLDELISTQRENYLLQFGSNAKDILSYFIQGNAAVSYDSFFSELFATLFSQISAMLPSFLGLIGVCILSAVVSVGEDGLLNKTMAKIIHLVCYSVAALILSVMFTSLIENIINTTESLRTQTEVVMPLLVTLTVLSGGEQGAAIYSPAALFLSQGIIELVIGFIYPVVILVLVLDFLSSLNPTISFSGFCKFFKSVIKWVIGICVGVYGIFLTVQGLSASLFDGITLRISKYIVGSSVPIVGGFLSGGFEMLTLASQLIKSSVGTCGVLLLLFEVLSPLLSVVAMALLLKGVAALIQPLGEGGIVSMFNNISNDLEYFIAGLLLVAFLYFMLVMGILHSVNYFI